MAPTPPDENRARVEIFEQRAQQAEIEAARLLVQRRSGIVLSGRIVNGKVELDQATLDEIARKFASAERSFVAVNAPFDPKPSTP